MKLCLKPFLYLPIILFFFPQFAFTLPGLKGTYLYFFVVLYILLGLLLYKDRTKIIGNFINFIKLTPFKYYVIVLVATIFSTLCASFIGLTTYSQNIHSIIFQILLYILPIFIYFSHVIDGYISYEDFIKFFVLLLWINLIIGFIAFIGQFFDIKIINSIFDFFANSRLLKVNLGIDAQVNVSNYVAFGLPRLDGLHEEPSYYARFLYLFLPFVYSFSNNQYKIVKNKNIDKLIHVTFIPFAWINIILTFSPIYLILSSTITIIYYFKEILLLVKKYSILIICLLLIVITLVVSIDLSETYLSRIINILANVHSFADFIIIEPSLATRIITFVNTFCVFLQHPIFGVGMGNIQAYMYNQYLNSPLPLTPEIISKTSITVAASGYAFFMQNYITAILAESGIFVFCIYVYYYSKLFKVISKLDKICKCITMNFWELIAKTIKISLIGLFIIFFYEMPTLRLELFFIIVMGLLFIRKILIQNIKETKEEHK